MTRLLIAASLTVVMLACSQGTGSRAGDGTRAAGATPAPVTGVEPAAAATTDGPAADLDVRCCEQCAAAAQRDPSGTDIGAFPCDRYRGEYNGAPGVDDRCAEYLGGQKVLLRDCWKITGK